MTLSFGGGAGVLTIPGVSSDGQQPGGLIIDGALQAGDSAAPLVPSSHYLYGQVQVWDAPGNQLDGDPVFQVIQREGLVDDANIQAFVVSRSGGLNGHQYLSPTAQVSDYTGSVAPLQNWSTGSGTVASLGQAGGLGLFGHPAPAAPSTLPQATITAITDANAKAAVQALADCLAAIGVLTIT